MMLEAWKNIRDYTVLAVTFPKTTVRNAGIMLSLRDASPRVRFALLTGYETDDARLCSKYLTSDDRVLELGSSIGFIALHCLKNVGIADFAMVEANSNLLPVMRENFALNDIGMPTYLNVAAAEQDGEMNFNVSRDYFASSLTNVSGAATPVAVKAQTIPSIIAQLPFGPNVLIMDIEGAEVSIPIEHLAPFDKIIVELHRRFVGDAAIDQLILRLAAAGFKQVESDGYSTVFLKANH